MTPVLLSNPGLPLAVYGNPGKRRRSKARRKNPVFLGSKAGMWATNPGLKRKLAKKFPGWKVTSIKVVKSNPRKSSRRRVKAARRNPRKAQMARTKSRRRRSPARSTRTGRFLKRRNPKLSRRTKRFQVSRAKRTVGRTYRRKGRTVVITRARVRRSKGRARKNLAVKWSGKRGKISYGGYGYRKGRRGRKKVYFTNPRRRNPAIVADYVGGLTSAPSNVMGLFKGGNTVKKVAFTAGGAIATYVGGGIASRAMAPLLANVPGMNNPMVQRVIGAAFPYTLAFVAAKVVNLGKMKNHVLLGGAVASILELLIPGQVAALIQRIPGLSSVPGVQGLAGLGGLNGPTDMLAGYVQAPSYAGVGEEMLAGYVQAPSYAGVGANDELAGYVQAPSYAGVGNADYLETDNYLKNSYLNG
jgi:hypothetical protein